MGKTMAEIIAERQAKLNADKATEKKIAEEKAEKRRIAAEKRKAKKAAEEKTVKESKPITTGKQIITLEIDWAAFEKHVTENRSKSAENIEEPKIYDRVFKPVISKGTVKSRTGKDYWLYEAITRVLTKNAGKFIKKVIREDII